MRLLLGRVSEVDSMSLAYTARFLTFLDTNALHRAGLICLENNVKDAGQKWGTWTFRHKTRIFGLYACSDFYQGRESNPSPSFFTGVDIRLALSTPNHITIGLATSTDE